MRVARRREVKVGDRTVWMKMKEEAMAPVTKLFDHDAYNEAADDLRGIKKMKKHEQLKVLAEGEHIVVGTEGEHVVLVLESKDAKCEIRFKLDEAEQFEKAFAKMRRRVALRVEARKSREAIEVNDVDEEDEE